MANQIRNKENYEVKLWAYAIGQYGETGGTRNDGLLLQIINGGSNIPFIITDDNLKVLGSNLVSERILDHPERLRQRIEQYSRQNVPIEIRSSWGGRTRYIYYGNSRLQRTLIYFPIVQLVVIAIFITLALIAFRSSKEDEQNKVWIGLAKETAHQLGTPISSLLGWVEYLREREVEESVTSEMDKDLTRLMKVADRFSKIGAEAILIQQVVNEIVGGSVMYFRSRIPRNVTLEYNGLASAPIKTMLNVALFEWVVENVLKNALDALQGKGTISVALFTTDDWVNIDFRDTGKGIAKSNWKKIFEPGYTTKTRGWGLGLSLARRIIEETHRGKIFVLSSEVGKGTTIRISLRQAE